MSVMYKSLNENERWALGSGAEGVPMWLVNAGEAEIPGG